MPLSVLVSAIASVWLNDKICILTSLLGWAMWNGFLYLSVWGFYLQLLHNSNAPKVSDGLAGLIVVQTHQIYMYSICGVTAQQNYIQQQLC